MEEPHNCQLHSLFWNMQANSRRAILTVRAPPVADVTSLPCEKTRCGGMDLWLLLSIRLAKVGAAEETGAPLLGRPSEGECVALGRPRDGEGKLWSEGKLDKLLTCSLFNGIKKRVKKTSREQIMKLCLKWMLSQILTSIEWHKPNRHWLWEEADLWLLCGYGSWNRHGDRRWGLGGCCLFPGQVTVWHLCRSTTSFRPKIKSSKLNIQSRHICWAGHLHRCQWDLSWKSLFRRLFISP